MTDTSPQKRILILDDDQIIIDSLQRVLERNNFEVMGHIVQNTPDALRVIEESPPFDLIITDLNYNSTRMKNGFELARQLKKSNNNTPLILFTSDEYQTTQQEARRLNMGYMCKDEFWNPNFEQKLLDTINSKLNPAQDLPPH